MEWPVFVFILGIYAVIGVQVGKFAEKKGRSFLAFFWLTIAVSPLITGIIVATMRPLESPAYRGVSTGNVNELAKAAEMHREGLLSLQEFELLKSKLLGSDGKNN